MAQVHMSEAELARDLHAVLEKVREGAEIIVEHEHRPVARITAMPDVKGRTISEAIAIAKQREKERGSRITLDPDFAADIEDVISHRQPWNPPSWD